MLQTEEAQSNGCYQVYEKLNRHIYLLGSFVDPGVSPPRTDYNNVGTLAGHVTSILCYITYDIRVTSFKDSYLSFPNNQYTKSNYLFSVWLLFTSILCYITYDIRVKVKLFVFCLVIVYQYIVLHNV